MVCGIYSVLHYILENGFTACYIQSVKLRTRGRYVVCAIYGVVQYTLGRCDVRALYTVFQNALEGAM